MPRKPRPYLPGLPCHVIQRGNNRQDCFLAPQDYRFYLSCLGDACRRYRVQVHAYVLMTNHIHLLLTPEDGYGISSVMQSLGRRYVQHVNRRYERTGTLWEGRHRASLVDADEYLIACQRYIELNPVRAGMVSHPAEYEWSSYKHNALGKPDGLVTPHPVFRALGRTEEESRFSYRRLFADPLEPAVVERIGVAADASMPLGGPTFRRRAEARLGRSLGRYVRGRPPRAKER